MEGTKLERFLHKNQHTQRKLLNPRSVDQKSIVLSSNHCSIGPLLENQQIYLCNMHCDETKSESWHVQSLN